MTFPLRGLYRRSVFCLRPRIVISKMATLSSPHTLTLTPQEKLLSDCLRDCAASLPQPLTVRFAGGWVRDKLLSQPSHDIDAALSDLSGKDFGHQFLSFYRDSELGKKYQVEAKQLGIGDKDARLDKIVLVEEDAEKSKHLAVAKMKLFGLEVDLVNLRTETYAAASRTPVTQEVGTAEQDAMRRDATVNALFYNIHTGLVEDFTGKGLQDMEKKLLRTPLEPVKTFEDDPLRVLRLIRFSSRLGFEIDAEAQQAMKLDSIHAALKLKISRERVRAEIIKAFEGPDPARALAHIHEYGLYASCFAEPHDVNPPDPQNLIKACESTSQVLPIRHLVDGLQLEQEAPSVPWLLAAYTPYAELSPERGIQALKEGMKGTVKEAKILSASLSNRLEISSLVTSLASTPSEASSSIKRSHVAMSLRRWGSSWGHQALFSLLCDLLTAPPSSNPEAKYTHFLFLLSTLQLDGSRAIDEKPLLDGRRRQKLLGKPGPANKIAETMVLEWQFDNVGGEVGACEQMVRDRREEILAMAEADAQALKLAKKTQKK